MRRVSFALVMILVLSFGLANAQMGVFSVEVTPLVTDAEATDFIAPGGFTVNIYHDNTTGQLRTGWSTPFVFYGTGNANLTGPGTDVSAAAGFVDPTFLGIWTMGAFISTESWDGDIQNNAGGMTGDLVNFSGLTLSGYGTGMGNMLAFFFNFDMATPQDPCTQIAGQFCVDSGDFVDNTYDWLFAPPENFGGAVCFDVKVPCNLPAVFDNGCPGVAQSLQWSDQYAMTFTGHDLDDPPNLPLLFSVVSGVGTIDGATGEYVYNPDCGDVGSQSAVIRIEDALGDGEECQIDFNVLNTAPVIAGDCDGEATIGTLAVPNTVGSFSATDANAGDVLVFSTAFDPVYVLTADVVGGDLVVVPTGVETTPGVPTVITVIVTDCNGDTDACDFNLNVVGVLPFDIVIEKEHGSTGLGVLQGHHTYVDVLKMEGTNEIHGFDFLIGYDASALTFIGAEQGQILTDLEWEYFTYRYSWNGNCGNACPTGLLRVVALGETNDGAHNPLGFVIPDGSVLFTMDFLVTNDRNFGCMYAPIYFYWHDCGDNTIAMYDQTNPEFTIETAVSEHVFHYGGTIIMYGEPYYEVTDMFWGFPTMFGVQWECLEGAGPDKPAPIPFIDFFGGGVDIICPDDIDDRGDVNLNGVSNEIADAVVFTNYFIYGLAAFVVNVEGQIAATEVNGDGMVLTVADLVYLIRVIVGDALPLPKLAPAGDLNVIVGDAVTMNAEIGAAAFTLEGASYVELGNGAIGMDMKVSDDLTKVLVFSMNQGMTASGDIIVTDGNVLSVDVADYNGNAYKSTIVPSEFALEQNYPNPFNPGTTVGMALPVATDWTLSIYNVAGQKVLDYSGFSEAGTVTINVDMTGMSSGIYFYKADAGEFSATKKMVLLK